MKIKIAVPWPQKEERQGRIRESLNLWEDRISLVICLVEPCSDPFLENYVTVLLDRNSTEIGGQVPKCFISDMIEKTRELHPSADWIGFGNSDCVPVGDIIEGNIEKEVIVYHRTDIEDWAHRFRVILDKPIESELVKNIWKLRQDGVPDKEICGNLNQKNIKPPEGYQEWHYKMLRQFFVEQGWVFFWGQDMFLFKSSIVDKVLSGYLKVKDPILGSGAFDPRLSKWLMDNFDATRMIHKIFHKIHESEWYVDEAEYEHNGGTFKVNMDDFEDQFFSSLCKEGQRGAIPKYIKYMVGKNNPELYKKIVVEDFADDLI